MRSLLAVRKCSLSKQHFFRYSSQNIPQDKTNIVKSNENTTSVENPKFNPSPFFADKKTEHSYFDNLLYAQQLQQEYREYLAQFDPSLKAQLNEAHDFQTNRSPTGFLLITALFLLFISYKYGFEYAMMESNYQSQKEEYLNATDETQQQILFTKWMQTMRLIISSYPIFSLEEKCNDWTQLVLPQLKTIENETMVAESIFSLVTILKNLQKLNSVTNRRYEFWIQKLTKKVFEEESLLDFIYMYHFMIHVSRSSVIQSHSRFNTFESLNSSLLQAFKQLLLTSTNHFYWQQPTINQSKLVHLLGNCLLIRNRDLNTVAIEVIQQNIQVAHQFKDKFLQINSQMEEGMYKQLLHKIITYNREEAALTRKKEDQNNRANQSPFDPLVLLHEVVKQIAILCWTITRVSPLSDVPPQVEYPMDEQSEWLRESLDIQLATIVAKLMMYPFSYLYMERMWKGLRMPAARIKAFQGALLKYFVIMELMVPLLEYVCFSKKALESEETKYQFLYFYMYFASHLIRSMSQVYLWKRCKFVLIPLFVTYGWAYSVKHMLTKYKVQ